MIVYNASMAFLGTASSYYVLTRRFSSPLTLLISNPLLTSLVKDLSLPIDRLAFSNPSP